MDQITGVPLRVELLKNPGALQRLWDDLQITDEVHALVFHLDPAFFIQLFAPQLERGEISVIADRQQASKLRQLMRDHPRLHAYAWSKNRLFHSKVICLPKLGVTHIGSHNLTRYSYIVAQNLTVRVESVEHCQDVMSLIWKLGNRAMPLAPAEPLE